MHNWRIRGAGILLILSSLWYIPWMLFNINWSAWWLAIPFAIANVMVAVTALVTLVNNWRRTIPKEKLVASGAEPVVGVLVPTCGEPPAMVERTVRSVLEQAWPVDKLRIIVGDDAHSPAIAQIVENVLADYPDATVIYYEPPRRGQPERRGDAKAGNLNAQLDLIQEKFPEVTLIETRDADDEVCDQMFLRQLAGQILSDPKISYVQTVKETHVSEGDPFSNNETLFYRGAMLARNASNAVFPCGSGLLWRMEALLHIGGFPGWNLVEDLQSGVEALRRGWRGIYLPIVGVYSQHAPEDIPNVYKQRGVWALDTIRLLVWGKVMKGLNFWQRLHFIELGLFYSLSFAIMIFLVAPILSLVFRVHPVATDHFSYIIHFWPFAASIELLLAALNGKQPYENMWRAREMWVGLSVVYIKACIKAITAGPNKKPAYKVTRKTHNFGWYWRETLTHAVIVTLLAVSIVFSIIMTPSLADLEVGTIFWAAFMMTLMGSFLTKSWFGMDWKKFLLLRLASLRFWGRRAVTAK